MLQQGPEGDDAEDHSRHSQRFGNCEAEPTGGRLATSCFMTTSTARL